MSKFKVGDTVKIKQGIQKGYLGIVNGVFYKEPSLVNISVNHYNCIYKEDWLEKVEGNKLFENNSVHSPSHYNESGIECIDAIRASLGPKGFQAYCKGNVMKYLWRYEYKNGLEDLEKAQVYLGWMISSLKQENSQ